MGTSTVNRLQPLNAREDVGHVTERSWGVRWSRSGVAFWHRRETFGRAPADARRSPGRGGWVAAGVVGLASIAVTAVGVAAGPVTSRSPEPLVSVRIPPTKALARMSARPVEPRPAVAAAAPRPAASLVVADVPPATPLTDATAEEAAGAAPTGREDAVAAAMKSGRMRSWVDLEAGVQGFVVVGDAQVEGDRTCRDVSVLIKGDGDSKVSRDRRCIRS